MPTTMHIRIKRDMGRVYHNFLKREANLIKALDKINKKGKGFDRGNNWTETNAVGRVWSF